MIIIRLSGGLGNQMFQYAFGKAIAQARGEKLHLETSFLDHNRTANSQFMPRDFELNLFQLSEIKRVPSLALFGKSVSFHLFRWANKLGLIREVREKAEGAFDPEIHKIVGQNLAFGGYWQSPLYFEGYADLIRNEFRFKEPLSEPSQAIAQQIAATESVCLHVRRGDYGLATNSQNLGLLSIEYYQKAIESITQKVANPYFFLFSDDPQWVLQNLPLSHPYTLVDVNGGKNSWQDLALMTLCKHNIVANSSFSWWGVWLGINPDKQVICPNPWFRSSAMSDMIPAHWTKLDALWVG